MGSATSLPLTLMYGDTGPSLDTLPGQATLLLAHLGMRPGQRTVQVECLKAPNVMKLDGVGPVDNRPSTD